MNSLRPDIKKGKWTEEEEQMIEYFHNTFGPKWSTMANIMKNRTDNDIKNKWNSMKRIEKAHREKWLLLNDIYSSSSLGGAAASRPSEQQQQGEGPRPLSFKAGEKVWVDQGKGKQPHEAKILEDCTALDKKVKIKWEMGCGKDEVLQSTVARNILDLDRDLDRDDGDGDGTNAGKRYRRTKRKRNA